MRGEGWGGELSTPSSRSGGRAGERGVNQIFFGAVKSGSNHFDHTNRVTKHVEVPKPQGPVTALLKVIRSYGVVVFRLIVAVPASVQLDQ
jgi:hypothetical protein